MPVPRGPSLASCSVAIATAVIADALEREQRYRARQRCSELALRAVLLRPEAVGWGLPGQGATHTTQVSRRSHHRLK